MVNGFSGERKTKSSYALKYEYSVLASGVLLKYHIGGEEMSLGNRGVKKRKYEKQMLET